MFFISVILDKPEVTKWPEMSSEVPAEYLNQLFSHFPQVLPENDPLFWIRKVWIDNVLYDSSCYNVL